MSWSDTRNGTNTQDEVGGLKPYDALPAAVYGHKLARRPGMRFVADDEANVNGRSSRAAVRSAVVQMHRANRYHEPPTH